MLVLDIAYAQISRFDDECSRPKKVYDMQVINVCVRLLTGGNLFYDGNYITPLYPKKVLMRCGVFIVWIQGVRLCLA
jgi:hypothetical protein